MEGDGTPPDLLIGQRALAVIVPTFTLALVVYLVRIRTRTRPKYCLNAADYTVSIAIFAEAVLVVLTIVTVSRGFGRPSYLLSADDIEVIGSTTFTVFFIAPWASNFARISISCLLLQITQDKMWRFILWSNIAIQGVLHAASNTAQLVECRPIRAIWASVPNKYCVPTEQIWIVAWVFNGIGIAGDIVCAVLPMLIIWRLSRSALEKTLLSVLMGLGLLAALAGMFKVLVMRSFNPMSENMVGDMMPAYLWSRIEENILIIAACAPLLKPPIESLLHRRFGLPCFGPRARELDSVYTIPHSWPKAKYFRGYGGGSASRTFSLR